MSGLKHCQTPDNICLENAQDISNTSLGHTNLQKVSMAKISTADAHTSEK